ncbi:MAG TPA: HRDC domain-containing protein [Rubricoccaceae bacterium]|nr:HRDC domain-containing protein [Rubricoccaceae bacterium]
MITTQQELAALVARARAAEAVALDTEFVWERTYYPRLGVVQLALAEDDVHLLDAAALDLTPLGALLADAAVVKVLHDAGQDLTILRRATGASPKNVFDTQRAAGFVGLSATLSLQDLFVETLGVSLPKGATRSNWLKRPLSAEQTAYAEDDVRYMLPARRVLLERAEALGRRAWVEEEMRRYDAPARYEEAEPEDLADRVKGRGIGGFSPLQRAVLRELVVWREREARRRDLPRRRVLDDEVLVETARLLPERIEALSIRGTPEKVLRRHAEDLLGAVRRGRALPPEARPQRPERPEDEDRLLAVTALLQAALAGHCTREAVDPGLVATKADLRALAESGPDADPAAHEVLRGWRRTFAGDALLGLLRGTAAVTLDADGWPRFAG